MAQMDASWRGWVTENLNRNCSPEEILGILLKHGFAVPEIRQSMGKKFPAQSAQLMHAATGGTDYKSLAEFPLIWLGKKRGIKYIENPKIQLFTLDNFLTAKECDALIKIIDHTLRPSTVTRFNGDERYRTSYTSDLVLLNKPIITAVDTKIARTLGICLPYSEGIQAQKYKVGEEFKPHTDFFEPNTSEYEEHARAQGNRTWTFMVYLSNTPKGGGTRFVNLDKTFYPKKGMAVIWNNLYANGMPNPNTLHHGMPVEKGRKYIITKWFRERGAGPMFYAN